MIGNCRTKIKSENRYSVVNDLTKHMKYIHKVVVTGKSNWCGLCHTAIGRCPANHGCFKGKDDIMLVQTDDGCDFKCDLCGKTFPSYRGLSNHKVSHRRNDIQLQYNKKNVLPIAGVALRTGGTSASSVTRNKTNGAASSSTLANRSISLNSSSRALSRTTTRKLIKPSEDKKKGNVTPHKFS